MKAENVNPINQYSEDLPEKFRNIIFGIIWAVGQYFNVIRDKLKQ